MWLITFSKPKISFSKFSNNLLSLFLSFYMISTNIRIDHKKCSLALNAFQYFNRDKKNTEIYFCKMKCMQIKRKNDINASQTNIANHITLSIVISFVTVNLFLWPTKFKTSCIKRANKFLNYFYYRLLLVIRIVIS